MGEPVHSSWKRVAGPSVEPVTLAEAKSSARIDGTAEDDAITAMIKEAREDLEAATARAFISQTWRLMLDRFPSCPPEIELKVCPVLAVTGITYIDPAGDSQTLDATKYVVDAQSEPGRIRLKSGQSWPAVDPRINAVTVTFTAGYGTSASDVPENVKRAIKLLVGDRYRHRDATSVRKGDDDLFQKLVRLLSWGAYP